jgi:hypothetical protein
MKARPFLITTLLQDIVLDLT